MMNNTEKDENKKKIMQPAYSKAELITLLQKAHNDFKMIDSKLKEILNAENIDAESIGNTIEKLKETNNNLIEFAKIRNRKIEELLKTIKN